MQININVNDFLNVDSIPKFFGLFPATNKSETVIITELLGDSLDNLFKRYNGFTPQTILKIGIQMVCLQPRFSSENE